MEKKYEPKRNTIVTRELLYSLAMEQQPSNRRRRTSVNLELVQEIRLEYLNILQITCLWPLKNLVKLKLNNNVIEKIENLESLTNLCELDLSFNRIRVIENLEALVNIHVLSFYDNQIEKIQGIGHMENLAILSVGKNNIAETDHIMYLRKLKQLRSLQISGNPCTETEGYLTRLYAFVPQLVYFGYKMIGDKEREDAIEANMRLLSELEEEDLKKQRGSEAIKREEEKIALQATSYVEHLEHDSLFQIMYNNDEDGKMLAHMSPEIEAAFDQYHQRFAEISQELFELGLKEESNRRAEIKALDDVVNDVLTKATNKARAILDSVQGKRTEVTVRVTQAMREAALAAGDGDIEDEVIDEIDQLARQLAYEFTEYVQSVWAKLLGDETVVHEQIEELSQLFEANINDMVSSFLEVAQDIFGQLRTLETEFAENLPKLLANYLNMVDEEDMTAFVREIYEDKDMLNNCLATSHFGHLQVIDDRQDRMTTRLKDWKEKFVNNLKSDESVRNRNRILEISHFLNYQKENATVAKLLGQQSELDVAGETGSEEGEVKSDERNLYPE